MMSWSISMLLRIVSATERLPAVWNTGAILGWRWRGQHLTKLTSKEKLSPSLKLRVQKGGASKTNPACKKSANLKHPVKSFFLSWFFRSTEDQSAQIYGLKTAQFWYERPEKWSLWKTFYWVLQICWFFACRAILWCSTLLHPQFLGWRQLLPTSELSWNFDW